MEVDAEEVNAVEVDARPEDGVAREDTENIPTAQDTDNGVDQQNTENIQTGQDTDNIETMDGEENGVDGEDTENNHTRPDTELQKGDHVTTVYKERWYVAEIHSVGKKVSLSYMKPSGSKWKWGQRYIATVSRKVILMKVAAPAKVPHSVLLDISAADKRKTEQLYEEYRKKTA